MFRRSRSGTPLPRCRSPSSRRGSSRDPACRRYISDRRSRRRRCFRRCYPPLCHNCRRQRSASRRPCGFPDGRSRRRLYEPGFAARRQSSAAWSVLFPLRSGRSCRRPWSPGLHCCSVQTSVPWRTFAAVRRGRSARRCPPRARFRRHPAAAAIHMADQPMYQTPPVPPHPVLRGIHTDPDRQTAAGTQARPHIRYRRRYSRPRRPEYRFAAR